MIAQASQIALLAAALWGGWSDIRFRRIPNLLCLITFIAGLGFGYAQHGLTWAELSAAHAAAALLIGMLLFQFRIVGGGDAKYYAAVSAWFSIKLFFYQIFLISLAGLIVVLVAFLIRKMIRNRELEADRKGAANNIPYGVAIAAGAVLTYFTM